MNFLFFLSRQRTTLKKYIEARNIQSYEELVTYIKELGLKVPKEEEIKYEFNSNVEERSVNPSNSEKKRISDKKSTKSKRTNSTRSGGSKTKQSVRKSTTKRRGKRVSDKVESIQPVSGSENTK